MKPSPRQWTTPPRRTFGKRRSGFALVVTLALIVLAAGVILAFFKQAASNRQIERVRAKRTEAEIIARSGCDYVTGLFLAEISGTAHSAVFSENGVTTYSPKTPRDAVPARLISGKITPGDASFDNLVRQSVAINGNADADLNASDDSSATPARNGRSVDASRWNLPRLVAGGTGFGAAQLPCWVYLDKISGATKTKSKSVTGRFAYNVYDVGGLLNVNAAGSPSALASRLPELKGSLAGADLTALGLTQPEIDSLVAFRNPAAQNGADAYIDDVNAAANRGFLLPGPDHYLGGRQELLRYARTKNPAFAACLPYLTHFSKSLSAPSCMPANPDATNPNFANVRIPDGATLVHYRDDGTAEPGHAMKAGDPLVQRRFSLAKLAWLTPTGPKAGISGAAIKACFGLSWNADEERWDYVGNSTATQSGIATLDTVAADKREPNFFELLKAGIASGSVGKASGDKTMAGTDNQQLENNKDLQILRIGANIIDCAGADNFPTRIALNFGGTDIEVAGVCDLPYFYTLWPFAFQKWDSADPTAKLTKIDLTYIPILLNPHRPALVSGTSPSSISVDISSGVLTRLDDNNGNLLVKGLTKSLSVLPAIQIPSASFESFRSGPQPIIGSASAASAVGTLVPYADSPVQDTQAFLIYSYENEAPPSVLLSGTVSTAQGHTPQPRVWVQNLIVRLRYQTPGGRWKTYATHCGNEAISTTGVDCSKSAMTCGPKYTAGTDRTSFSSAPSMALWDPRSNRFGPNWFSERTIRALPPLTKPTSSGERLVTGDPYPGWSGNKTNDPVYYGMWPQGGKSLSFTGGKYTNIADPDGIFRPMDGWLSVNGDANPYYDIGSGGDSLVTTSRNRPILLHRPYRSVAELGYVFRDTPWKTLSFFDETSADGALLDLFSVVDEPRVTDGRVSLQTRQPLVLKSLIQGQTRNADDSAPLDASTAAQLAESYAGYSFDGDNVPTGTMPENLAQLPSFLSTTGFTAIIGDHNKYGREAVVRALAGAAQTRTWNFLIDIVAQSGRFPGSGLDAGDFLVEGERRYWFSVAIDRYTGKVVAQQLESVNE